eukprot:TRINITY_DN2704_c0_g1_i12.p1 TRINITY_DN2704_c0_g1~~TRINITY_DN2704_c0_g1_i12.p1  ORF type:complete len:364 (+),score=58.18 TRINITY_DN2704_c0_g1_i12:401-1492(+)
MLLKRFLFTHLSFVTKKIPLHKQYSNPSFAEIKITYRTKCTRVLDKLEKLKPMVIQLYKNRTGPGEQRLHQPKPEQNLDETPNSSSSLLGVVVQRPYENITDSNTKVKNGEEENFDLKDRLFRLSPNSMTPNTCNMSYTTHLDQELDSLLDDDIQHGFCTERKTDNGESNKHTCLELSNVVSTNSIPQTSFVTTLYPFSAPFSEVTEVANIVSVSPSTESTPKKPQKEPTYDAETTLVVNTEKFSKIDPLYPTTSGSTETQPFCNGYLSIPNMCTLLSNRPSTTCSLHLKSQLLQHELQGYSPETRNLLYPTCLIQEPDSDPKECSSAGTNLVNGKRQRSSELVTTDDLCKRRKLGTSSENVL